MSDSFTHTPGWLRHFRERLVPVDVAVNAIRPDDNIYSNLGPNSDFLIAALIASGKPVSYTAIGTDLTAMTQELAETFKVNILFGSANSRKGLEAFLADYTPWWVYGAHKAVDEDRPGAHQIDVSLIRVTPPNRAGWCCLGNSVWDAKYVSQRARTTIAVVSDGVPRTYGDTWIPATDIDWFIEVESSAAPAATVASQRATLQANGQDPIVRAMTEHLRDIVRDGDTVQIGIGSHTSGIVQAGLLSDKNDLGYFAELSPPGVVELVKEGVITGRYLKTHPFKFVTTTAGQLPEEQELINDNPTFEFYGTEYIHSPTAIARNDNMVAINGALSVDLGGQIAAGQFGTRVWSGTGGQLAYQLGAYMSKGGRAVTLLPSTAQGGKISRIVAEMPAGQIITVPRDIADIIVTEYGVAELLNKTQRERARALIEIAHPDFRDDLRKEAKRLYGA